MKRKTLKHEYFAAFTISALLLSILGAAQADEYYDSGVIAEIDYTVDGHVWIEDATVTMIDPAHIMGAVITGSGAVFDVYGGQIDYMLLVSTSGNELPDADVTIYATDFTVDGIPVDPNTTELYLAGQVLSGIYVTGEPFAYMVDCAITGNTDYIHYQTVKLGWLVSEPDIDVSETEYDFGSVDIGTTQNGTVTVYNLGNANLTVQSLSMIQDENIQFEFTELLQLPFTLEPESSIDLEVLYTPVVAGPSEAIFQIASDDPNEPVIEVVLSGQGLEVVLSPEEQIQDIIDYLKQGLEDGTITGADQRYRHAFGHRSKWDRWNRWDRWNKRAEMQTRIILKMLYMAQNLIDAEYDLYAAHVLTMVDKKTDGRKRPADLLQGQGVEELNTRINELIEILKNK